MENLKWKMKNSEWRPFDRGSGRGSGLVISFQWHQDVLNNVPSLNSRQWLGLLNFSFSILNFKFSNFHSEF